MKNNSAACLLSLLIISALPPEAKAAPRKKAPVISVKFSPNGGAEDAIVAGIDDARSEILLQAYSFTANNIAQALVRAHTRGVAVSVIVDREATGNPHSVVPYLLNNNIIVYVDGQHAIAHNKVIVIDNKTVFTGSYNFSEGANKKNAENSLRIDDEPTAIIYAANWKKHQEHSPLYPKR